MRTFRRSSLCLLAASAVFLGGAVVARSEEISWASIGPNNGKVNTIAIDPTDPAKVYAGTDGGVFVSNDGGETWRPSNEGFGDSQLRQVTKLSMDPSNPKRLFALVYNGPTRRSDDGGQTWVTLSGGMGLEAVASREDPDKIFAILIGGVGRTVFRSLDGGWNWQPLRVVDLYDLLCLAAAPSDRATLYAGNEQGFVVKSTDSGVSWSFATAGLGGAIRVECLAVDPADSGTVFAGSWGGPFKSTNGGTSWNLATVGMGKKRIEAMTIDPTDGRKVYASTTDIYKMPKGLFTSTDGGATWTTAIDGLPSAVIRALAVDPLHPQTVFAATDVGLYKSTDSGRSWSPSGRGLAGFRVTDLKVARQDSASVYVATSDWGVHATHNAGGNWVEPNTGLAEKRAYSLAIDHGDARVAYVGTRAGVFKSVDGATSWQPASNGLPIGGVAGLVMDSLDPRTLAVALSGRGLFRSIDGGGSWVPAGTGVRYPTSISWIISDPSRTGAAYLEAFGIYKTTDGGVSWGSVDAPRWSWAAGAVAPSDSDRIWLVGNEMAKSTDGGVTWQRPTNPLGISGDTLTAVAIDPVDPRIVFVGSSWSGVFVTVDDGESWMPLEKGLMHGHVTAIELDQDHPRNVYVGTDGAGVFRLTRPDQPAIVTPCPITPWVAGRTLSLGLSAVGGVPPYTWSVAGGLPRGLSLAAGTGVLSGNISSTGEWPLALQVRDSASGTAVADCSIRVFTALGIPNQTPFVTLPGGLLGTAYSQQLTASGGVPPYIWSAEHGDLITLGLTVNRDGRISGVLGTLGFPRFAVKVRDASGQVAGAYVEIPIREARLQRRLRRP